jgi:hypothetical protein
MEGSQWSESTTALTGPQYPFLSFRPQPVLGCSGTTPLIPQSPLTLPPEPAIAGAPGQPQLGKSTSAWQLRLSHQRYNLDQPPIIVPPQELELETCAIVWKRDSCYCSIRYNLPGLTCNGYTVRVSSKLAALLFHSSPIICDEP